MNTQEKLENSQRYIREGGWLARNVLTDYFEQARKELEGLNMRNSDEAEKMRKALTLEFDNFANFWAKEKEITFSDNIHE